MTTQKLSSVTGKKKTAVASVSLTHSQSPSFTINGREAREYFQGREFPLVLSLFPFTASGILYTSYKISVKVTGSGLVSQAFAIRHAIAKYIAKVFEEKRLLIKKAGLLTRDSRIVERKKPGLAKARKKEQYSKR